MAPRDFSLLPQKALDRIAAEAANLEETGLPLLCLRNTSRRFYHATSPQFFNHIRITFTNRKQLVHELEVVTDLLKGGGGIGWAKTLSISGHMTDSEDEARARWTEDPFQNVKRLENWDRGLPRFEEYLDFPMNKDYEIWRRTDEPGDEPDDEPDERTRLNGVLAPLVSFIKFLHNLKDVIWICHLQQPPRSILQAIEQHPNRIRLHVRPLHFTSAVRVPFRVPGEENKWDFPPLHPDDQILANAESLSTMAMFHQYAQPDLVTKYSHNKDLAYRMVKGYAPNLRRAEILDMDRLGGREERPLEWTHLASYEPAADSIGKLEHFKFEGHKEWTLRDNLSVWKGITDFRVLQSLHLACPLLPEGLFQLYEIRDDLPALKELKLLEVRDKLMPPDPFAPPLPIWQVPPPPANPAEHQRGMADVNLAHLLTRLPQLERVFLFGDLGVYTRSAVTESLPNLTALTIADDSYFAENRVPCTIWAENAENLARTAPKLEVLRCAVKRTNDEEELGIYRALGKLPRLRYVSMAMHRWWDHATEEEIYRLTPQGMRQLLAFGALDGTLADSIFETIDGVDGSTHSLSRVDIAGVNRPFELNDDFGREFDLWMLWIGRTCTAKRGHTGITNPIDNEEETRDSINDLMSYTPWGEERCRWSNAARRSIWNPHGKESVWWTRWTSWPLGQALGWPGMRVQVVNDYEVQLEEEQRVEDEQRRRRERLAALAAAAEAALAEEEEEEEREGE